MRLSIEHLTAYRFTEPQMRIVELLRLTPSDNDAQTVVDWRIDANCDVRLKPGRDGFGNAIHMLYCDGPLDTLEITVRGEVLTEDRAGIVSGTSEPLPPALFARATRLTHADEAISGLLATLAGYDPIERLHMLNALVHARVRRLPGRGYPERTAAQAFAAGAGSARDIAHIFVAAARALGTPARVVSGHCLGCAEGQPGQTAHNWAEAHVGGLGWIGLCPSFGISPDERYVRVAAGLDGRSAAPISGARRGGGVEALDVRVDVSQA